MILIAACDLCEVSLSSLLCAVSFVRAASLAAYGRCRVVPPVVVYSLLVTLGLIMRREANEATRHGKDAQSVHFLLHIVLVVVFPDTKAGCVCLGEPSLLASSARYHWQNSNCL